MGIVSFKPGNIVYLGTTRFEVVGDYDLKSVLAKNAETGDYRVLHITSLKSAPEEKNDNGAGIKTTEYCNPKHWKIALKRHEIIEPLLKDNRTKDEVKKRGKQFGMSADTVYRHIRNFERTGTISSLVPGYDRRGGPGKPRIGEAQESIITTVLGKYYLNKQRLKPETVYKKVKKLCKDANVKPPHKNTLINRIQNLPPSEVDKERFGRQHSDNRYGEKPDHFPGGDYPLDVIQIDHTPLDIHVVDEEYRQSLSRRPFLTVAIDVFSRCIVGGYISPDPPSYFSVSQCITNALLPKDKFLRSLNVEGDWDVWGKPRLILADNAWEFRGKDLKQVVCMEDYGIILEWRPVKKPEYGGHIERLCGTLNKEIHELPGTTFSNPGERGNYDSEAEAVMTLEELEHWVVDLVVNSYHKKPHSGIVMPPMKKYEIGIRGDDSTPGRGLPDKIDDEERLRITLYPHFKRTIQRDGVVFEGIHYYSEVLRKWINAKEGKGKKNFIFKYNPRDMSVIYFLDPELKTYFSIPYRNMGNKPISLWDWRAAIKYLKAKGVEDYDEAAVFRAAEHRERHVEAASEKTKTARRVKSASKFHKRKLDNEKKSIAEAKGAEPAASQTAKEAKKAQLDTLFRDVKPFDGIKILGKRAERSDRSDD